jgi:hypothetical protein
MNAEILEKLLIDQALGALPPEVESLLKAYLQKDAPANQESRQWEVVVDNAQRSLAAEMPALPPFDREKLQARINTRKNWRRAAQFSAIGAGMAACLVIGMLMGYGRAAETARIAQTAGSKALQPIPTALATPSGEQKTAAVSDFWSESRLRALAEQPHPPQKMPEFHGMPVFNGFKQLGD